MHDAPAAPLCARLCVLTLPADAFACPHLRPQGTNGHVDNVACFAQPGVVLLVRPHRARVVYGDVYMHSRASI
jgi:hypothetical protein